jgi:predicted Rdx family selenoprotein
VIIPSRGGVFEVVVDGDLVFSKKAVGAHAELDDLLKMVREKVAG